MDQKIGQLKLVFFTSIKKPRKKPIIEKKKGFLGLIKKNKTKYIGLNRFFI